MPGSGGRFSFKKVTTLSFMSSTTMFSGTFDNIFVLSNGWMPHVLNPIISDDIISKLLKNVKGFVREEVLTVKSFSL